jgi:hypothetical protein
MPDITLENGTIVKGFPDNPTQDDLAKLDRIKKKYQTVSQPTPTSPSDKQRSPLQSGLMGISQGATFGLADEAIARLESMRTQYTDKPRSYEDVLQEAKGMYKQASEQNPASYLTGEIGAGVVAPIGQAVTGAKLGRLATIGAGTGALSGLGYSEGQDIGQVAKDVAIGTALGGGLPVLGRGIAIGAQKAKVLADEAIKTSLTGFTGKTRAFLDQLDKNPEQVKRIEEKFAGDLQTEVLPEISLKIDRFVERNPFAQRAKLNSRLSLEKIPENVRVNKSPAINEIDKVLDILKKDNVTNTSREAQGILKEYRSRIINELNPSGTETPSIDIPGRDLKVFLQNIGDDIETHGGYGNPLKNTKVGQTLKNVRRSLDQELKDKAPDYRDIMRTVNNDTAASVRLTKQFMNKEGVDSGKINSFLNRTTQKPINMEIDKPTKRAVELLQQDRPLQTLGQDIKDINLKKAIESRGNQGSNVMLTPAIGGGFAGSALGNIIAGTPGGFAGGALGTFLGGIAGRQLEQKGGKISESAMRLSKGFRTPTAIPEATQRGFQAQQGIQKGLLDQFLTENAGEVRRKREMESKFQQDNQNRVTK